MSGQGGVPTGQRPGDGGGPTLRVAGGILTALFGVFLLLVVSMVVSSRFGPASQDPHGFAMILGTVLSLPVAVLTAISVTLVFPRSRRPLALAISLLVALFLCAGLVVLLVTA